MSPRHTNDENEPIMTDIEPTMPGEKQEDWTIIEGNEKESVPEVVDEEIALASHLSDTCDRSGASSDLSIGHAVPSLVITDSPSTDEAAAAIRAAVDAAAMSDKEPLSPQVQAIKTAADAVSAVGLSTMPDGAPLPEGTVPVIVEAGSVQESKLQATLRKAGVAVAGGVMVGVGLVMIPLPTPCGVVVAASGMGVLATEFPEAQKVIDVSREKALKARDRLVESIEKSAVEHAAKEEEFSKLQASKKEEESESLMASREGGSAEKTNHLNSANNGPKIFMNEREKERQLRLQQGMSSNSSTAQSGFGQSRYQTRRTVSRNNAPGIANDDEGLSVEESIDLARRTFRKTANQLGQTVLPYLKRLDTTTSDANAPNGSGSNTNGKSETKSNFLSDSFLPYFGMQPKSAPGSRATSPRKSREQSMGTPMLAKGGSYDSPAPTSPQDILPYMNSPRKVKAETPENKATVEGDKPVMQSF